MKNFPLGILRVLGLVLIALACVALFTAHSLNDLGWLISSLSMFGVGLGFANRDARITKTKPLPAAASSSTMTDGIDTGKGAFGDQVADFEFLLTIPALTTTMLPDTRTATYIIEHDTDAAFGTVATLNVGSVVQTGAAGAGAAATSHRFRLPTDAKRYIRAKCTLGASTTDSSAVSMELAALT
jgi:hypothetical protein